MRKQLEAENTRLRKALQEISTLTVYIDGVRLSDPSEFMRDIARTALKEPK